MKTSRDSRLLRGIASFLRVLGWIGLVLGIIVAIALLFTGLPPFLRWVGVFLAVAGAIGWFVPMYGFGSVLHLLLDIERSTDLSAIQAAPK
jgi:magnesium-transporting ATPase (P-type)